MFGFFSLPQLDQNSSKISLYSMRLTCFICMSFTQSCWRAKTERFKKQTASEFTVSVGFVHFPHKPHISALSCLMFTAEAKTVQSDTGDGL